MLQSIGKCSARACSRSAYKSFYTTSGINHSFRQGIQTGQFPAPVRPELNPDELTLQPLDRRWQAIWQDEQRLNKDLWAEQKGKKMYILPMFPYPSGDLHLGHLRVYTISDVLARFKRMQGYNVVHPIGWDAFGLPAENAAIARGVDPATWTQLNISKMKSQLQAMNGHWDWDREFATCDPKFYKHTQSLFLLLHENGLAYQAESLVNYDPIDKTVLANEQVDGNGHSWRSGAKVEKKMLKQWFFKISAFREELLKDLELLAKDGAWPERILTQQKNWLGKSTGARIKFKVVTANTQDYRDIEVFTTRPDTLFGVQYIALAASHPIVQEAAKTDTKLQDFLTEMSELPEDSKAGYLLQGVEATNPLANEETTPPATKAPLPIYVAPYVLGDYGDGAVMGVPGHDTRDYGFWKLNQGNATIRMVVDPIVAPKKDANNQAFLLHGKLTSLCGPYSGQTTEKATKNILKYLQSKNLGTKSESWRLRDWLISRQRYWGTPIPIIHCDNCGPVPVPQNQLPVELPSVQNHWEAGKIGNPLEDAHDWVNTSCPRCHGAAKRDTDTMDTFVDSSWYFMRFLDPTNEAMPFSPELADEMLPVDVYVGGVEHAILHLLYARFISKFISTTGLWKSASSGEPFKKVIAQGMVHGKTYTDPSTGRFLKPVEVDLADPKQPVIVASGEIANISFEKMSKSKYNGVDPTICMAKYGVDATRAHILFQAPVSEVLEWDEEKISGITRWMGRIRDHLVAHRLYMFSENTSTFGGEHSTAKNLFKVAEIVLAKATAEPQPVFFRGKNRDMEKLLNELFANDRKLWRAVQNTIGSVTRAYGETYSLNTAVSDLMSLTNALVVHSSYWPKEDDISPGMYHYNPEIAVLAWRTLIQMMAPITPAFSEEMWILLHSEREQRFFPKRDGLIDKLVYKNRFFHRLYVSWKFPNGFPKGEVIVFPTPRFSYRYTPKNAKAESVFRVPFPEQDGMLEELGETTQKCAVQINGKMKFVVEIPIPEERLGGKELERWIVREVLGTEEGAWKLKGKLDVKRAKKIIVIKRGKTINFVL